MEVPELVKLAFARVQRVEPEDVGKIFGVMLLREPDEDELVQLAYGPEAALLAKIDHSKAAITLIYARCSASAHGPATATAPGGGGGGGYQQQQQLCSRSPIPCGGVCHYPPAASAAFGYHRPQYWPDSPAHRRRRRLRRSRSSCLPGSSSTPPREALTRCAAAKTSSTITLAAGTTTRPDVRGQHQIDGSLLSSTLL